MPASIRISPVNSLLFLSDPDGGVPPEPVWGAKILSTPSCISFACFPEVDGPTSISLGARNDVDPGTLPVFEGDLETPHRAVVIMTVDLETVLKMDVPGERTHVCIWYSHPQWPEKIAIGLS